MDLPARHFSLDPRDGEQAAQAMPSAMMEMEMMLGRVAMMAAVVLLATEIGTGTSLPEQLMTAWEKTLH